MLEYVRGKASDRKLRLFACSCCRRIWHVLSDYRSRRALEVAERYADSWTIADDDEFLTAKREADDAWKTNGSRPEAESKWNAFFCGAYAASHTLVGRCRDESKWPLIVVAFSHEAEIAAGMSVHPTENAHQAALLRDIVDNPFRSVRIDPSWLRWHNGLLVSMVRQMYEPRDFTDMPILADALEDAGCTNADILTHCRSSGEHVRGCWVVDLLLGKE
jgi:hypothetical protein